MKKVEWNKYREGFQDCWLWQFGEGPFEVSSEQEVPAKPNYLGGKIPITYELGKWYTIKVPDAAYQYRKECGINKVTFFHEKWFKILDNDDINT